MGGAKDRVDILGVDVADIHVQQTGFHRIQPFETFLEEHLMELRHIDCHTTTQNLLPRR
ncbi:hypothetical protein [Methylomonas koyamae]|uniref:hypothetical protein n=1 Tax=Methylomonas koyamae TaxID=702114 RepID=UPI000A869F90|nr:hypothetical protein [Methylomonas koyamae]